MSKKILWIGIGAAVILAMAVALAMPKSKSGNSTKAMDMSSSLASAVSTNAVSIKNYMFSPMTIRVKAGTTVTWTNDDGVHHNVVADQMSSSAPNGQLIGQDEKYSFTFTKPGTYTFHCAPHPYMHGTVIVTD